MLTFCHKQQFPVLVRLCQNALYRLNNISTVTMRQHNDAYQIASHSYVLLLFCLKIVNLLLCLLLSVLLFFCLRYYVLLSLLSPSRHEQVRAK